MDSQQLSILAHTRSPFNDIYVIERENLREMWFRAGGGFFLQSRIDLDRPGGLALVYCRLLLAPLLLNPDPSRILMIGLGGGVLPRFFHDAYPEIEIDVVEVDPRVVDLARRFFGFRGSPRLRVTEGDGRAFVKQRERRYDMVFLDAFKGGSVPYHLKTVEFYQEIARSLQAHGVLATNLYGKSNTLKPRDRKTLESMFQRVTFFEDPGRLATVCVAALEDWGGSLAELRKNTGRLPQPVQRNLSWLENTEMIGTESSVEPRAAVFEDDFEASEFFAAVQRNNKNDPFGTPRYPIRATR